MADIVSQAVAQGAELVLLPELSTTGLLATHGDFDHLLGRISSLDFFVSLALMPVSMALAGPLGEIIPIWLIFLLVGLASPVLSVIAIVCGRMLRNEVEHPLERTLEPADEPAEA